MELLEHIIRLQNGYTQIYMMMREVDNEVNGKAAAEGLS